MNLITLTRSNPLRSATLLISLLLVSCSTTTAVPQPSPVVPATETPTSVSISTSTPTLTPTIISPTRILQTASPTPYPAPYVCSPLDGIRLNQLNEIISNPLNIPKPGFDDGHQGIDLAFYRFGDRVGMAGLPIQSVMPGKVSSVITDRLPYGNAIIIETPLEYLPSGWIDRVNLPPRASPNQPAPAMNCPTLDFGPYTGSQYYSLYLLYAHMQSPTTLKTGQDVTCGEKIGAVGTTGKSVNEHLHLETRLGPSRVRFLSMAYYDTSRTDEEAANYCTWRVTGIFQMFDPASLLAAGIQR